jgi:hypothetical protein
VKNNASRRGWGREGLFVLSCLTLLGRPSTAAVLEMGAIPVVPALSAAISLGGARVAAPGLVPIAPALSAAYAPALASPALIAPSAIVAASAAQPAETAAAAAVPAVVGNGLAPAAAAPANFAVLTQVQGSVAAMSAPGGVPEREIAQLYQGKAGESSEAPVPNGSFGSVKPAPAASIPLTRRSEAEAYSFQSSLSPREMLARLNSQGAYRWELGDNETHGTMLVTRPFGDRTRLRIVERNGRYHFDIVFRSDDPKAGEKWEALRADVLQSLLPILGAEAVSAADNLD